MKEKVINDEIERVNRAMAQEGMPLTEEDKNNLKEVISGKISYDEKRKEIISDTIKENGVRINEELRKL